jgi:hypothetical protein
VLGCTGKRQRQRGATMADGLHCRGSARQVDPPGNVAAAAAHAKGPAGYGAEDAARLRSRRVKAERPKRNLSVKSAALDMEDEFVALCHGLRRGRDVRRRVVHRSGIQVTIVMAASTTPIAVPLR